MSHTSDVAKPDDKSKVITIDLTGERQRLYDLQYSETAGSSKRDDHKGDYRLVINLSEDYAGVVPAAKLNETSIYAFKLLIDDENFHYMHPYSKAVVLNVYKHPKQKGTMVAFDTAPVYGRLFIGAELAFRVLLDSEIKLNKKDNETYNANNPDTFSLKRTIGSAQRDTLMHTLWVYGAERHLQKDYWTRLAR